MQRALFRDTTPIHFQPQATRVLPGHGRGMLERALNDAEFGATDSVLRRALAIAANVLGGSLFLAALVALPHVAAWILA